MYSPYIYFNPESPLALRSNDMRRNLHGKMVAFEGQLTSFRSEMDEKYRQVISERQLYEVFETKGRLDDSYIDINKKYSYIEENIGRGILTAEQHGKFQRFYNSLMDSWLAMDKTFHAKFGQYKSMMTRNISAHLLDPEMISLNEDTNSTYAMYVSTGDIVANVSLMPLYYFCAFFREIAESATACKVNACRDRELTIDEDYNEGSMLPPVTPMQVR